MNVLEGVLLPVIVDGLATRKDGSVSIKLETQELAPTQAAGLFDLRGKVAYCYLSVRDVDANAKKIIDSLDPELKGKTPGQRLRGVLYRYWEQNKGTNPSINQTFEDFYKSRMESFIEGIKQELNP